MVLNMIQNDLKNIKELGLTYKLDAAVNRKDSFYQHIIAEKNK